MVQTRMSVFTGIDLTEGWLCPPVEHPNPRESPSGVPLVHFPPKKWTFDGLRFDHHAETTPGARNAQKLLLNNPAKKVFATAVRTARRGLNTKCFGLAVGVGLAY